MYNKILLLFVAIIVLSGCRHKKQQEATDTLVSGVITIVADENLQNILGKAGNRGTQSRWVRKKFIA